MPSPYDDPEVRRLTTALAVLRRESKTAAIRSVLRAEVTKIRRRLREEERRRRGAAG